MKPTKHESRPKEWIPFVNFAMVQDTPASLKLSEHLFPFEGATADPKYLWGLYGTTSINQGLFLADAYATKHKKRPLTVQAWYRIDHFDQVRSQLSREIAELSGFLHLDRLKTDFREEVRQFILNCMHQEMSAAQLTRSKDLPLDQLIAKHPRYVRSILEANRKINVVVHPVYQTYDKSNTRTLHVVTVRAIKSRVMAAEVRYLEDQVKVEI